MALLFRNLRIHQIFGANTEVGKTVFSTILCRSAAQLGEQSHYVKPVGTGGYGDDWHVSTFAEPTTSQCLHYFHEPVSPHLAAQRASQKDAGIKPPGDDQVNEGIRRVAKSIARGLMPGELGSLIVETAGGPHSPTLSGASQSEAYRDLRLPAVLIASHHLGGISTTLSAYESLLLRGYDIEALLCFEEDYYENHRYFQHWAADRNIPFASVKQPPSAPQEPLSTMNADTDPSTNLTPHRETLRTRDIAAMRSYYDRVCSAQDSTHDHTTTTIANLTRALRARHRSRVASLDDAARLTRQHVWWPFVQHSLTTKDSEVMVIDSAIRDGFQVYTSSEKGKADEQKALLASTFDGSASWWTQCLGHARTELTLAAAHAAGRYGHVIFPSAAHKPALDLTQTLMTTVGKGWADRVFFSDNGSTGMEVALKMALRYSAKHIASTGEHSRSQPDKSGEKLQLGVLGLAGSYHGDTIGAMDASEPSVYSTSVEWYAGRGFWLNPPSVSFIDGKPTVRFEGERWKASHESASSKPAVFESLSDIYDVERRLQDSSESSLVHVYRRHIDHWARHARDHLGITFGAVIMEPVVMGAAGQIFVDPLFQRLLVDYARGGATTEPASGGSGMQALPVIFDEVYMGLYRVGRLRGADFLGVQPDIACYAKILTGGLVPMSVTLASRKIFDVFLGQEKQEALLHGHSYTAHPVGCSVANATLDIIRKHDAGSNEWNEAKAAWSSLSSSKREDDPRTSVPHSSSQGSHAAPFSLWKREFVEAVSRLSNVDSAMAMGTVLVIHLRDDHNAGYQSNVSKTLLEKLRWPSKDGTTETSPSSDVDDGHLPIHCRPLGNTVYWMSSLDTPFATLRAVEKRIWNALQEH